MSRTIAGREVGEIGVGGGRLFWPLDDGPDLIRHALALGMNLFDTADIYGVSEETLGDGLSEAPRDTYAIVTKFGERYRRDANSRIETFRDFSPERMEKSLARSLSRLGTSYVDVLLLHGPPSLEAVPAETWTELEHQRRIGRVRAFGVSVDDAALALAFIERGATVVEILLNLLHQAPRSMLAPAREAGVTVLAKVPLAGGSLTDRFGADWPPPDDIRRQRWGASFAERRGVVPRLARSLVRPGRTLAQAALAWLLSLGDHVIPIPATSTRAQLEELARAAGMRLSEEEMDAVRELEQSAMPF